MNTKPQLFSGLKEDGEQTKQFGMDLQHCYETGKGFSRRNYTAIHQGFSANEISGDLKVTVRGINKIVDHYRCYGTMLPFTQRGSEAHIMTDYLLQCVELWKLEKPSVYGKALFR